MMARVFDKPFTVDLALCLIVYAFIFAYTMLPVPGAGLICMGSVFSAIGVPAGTVMFFLCIEPLIDMAANSQQNSREE
ncbi:MAG: cation:dicarboxylase symporter family transporter [Schwartzia sp.]|nr:cation:dicarboxylase symporter family transporter [Schwartzia sp. (in: firmicutes)]